MRCDAKFFGLKNLPHIDISRDAMEEMARESISMGLTVPGVQKKLSLHLSDEESGRLTLVGYPAGYILKPQTENFEQLPEAEALVMDIADLLGARTVPHGLVEVNGELAYICKRVDRPDGEVLAMEDFCQISGRLTQDKYRSSYEKCGSIIRSYSQMTGFDLSEFFLRLVICFITGNSDMHLKNFSLIERTPASREFILSPAYDLLPVNLIMPEDTEETALTLNGKKSRLRREDFLKLAETIGVPEKAASKMIASTIAKTGKAEELVRKSYLSEEMKIKMNEMMEERSKRLMSFEKTG